MESSFSLAKLLLGLQMMLVEGTSKPGDASHPGRVAKAEAQSCSVHSRKEVWASGRVVSVCIKLQCSLVWAHTAQERLCSHISCS